MVPLRFKQATRSCPSPARRIVEFRARQKIRGVAACDKHLAIWQQRGRMIITSVCEAAGGRPSPAHWIVEFRARQGVKVKTACDEHLAVRQ